MLAGEVIRSSGATFDLHVGHLAPMKHLLSALSPDDQRMIMACPISATRVRSRRLYERIRPPQ